jgi:regulatory protein
MIYNTEEYLKARISAFKFITYKRRTIKETENKLRNLEIKDEYIKSIIDELIELEYLNDEIYVQKFIEKNSKISLTMIKLKLREKGIEQNIIDNYFVACEYDESDKIKKLLEKKKFSNELSIDEITKIKVYLLRKGFKKNDIENVIKNYY